MRPSNLGPTRPFLLWYGFITLWAALVAGCGVQAAGHSTIVSQRIVKDSADARARAILLADLAARSSVYYSPPDSNSLQIIRDSSKLVPGVVYYWGQYAPPHAADVVFRSLVGLARDTVHLIKTTADWARTIGPQGLSRSQSDPLGGCAEIIYTTGNHRAPRVWPVIYSEQVSLQTLPGRLPEVAVLDTLERARVDRSKDGLVRARFWSIERDDLRKYECVISISEANLVVVDSLPGYGFL